MKKLYILLSLFTFSFSLFTLKAQPKLVVTDVSFPSGMKLVVGSVGTFVYHLENNGTLGSKIDTIIFSVTPNANVFYAGQYYMTVSDSCDSTYFNLCSNFNLPLHNIYTLSTTDTITSAMINTLTGSPYLGQHQSIYLYLTFVVLNCQNTGGVDSFFVNASSHLIDTNILTAPVNINYGTPALTVKVHGFDSASFCPYAHKGKAVAGFTVLNTDGDTAHPLAFADSIRFYAYVTQNIGTLDTSTFKVNGVHVPSSIITTYTSNSLGINYNSYMVDFTTYNFSDSCTPFGNNTLQDVNGFGYIDELSAGQTFTITATILYDTLTCPGYAQCGTTGWYLPLGGVTWNDQCGTMPWLPAKLSPLNDISAFNDYKYSTTPISSSRALTLPSDVTSDTPDFNANVCPIYNQQWQPYGFSFDCPNENYQMVMPLPTGYHLNSAGLTVALFDSNITTHSNLYSDTAILAEPPAGCSGPPETLHPTIQEFYTPVHEIIMNFGNLSVGNCSGYSEAYIVNCYNLPLRLDCAELPSYSRSADPFNYYFQFICDSAGCDSCGDELACASSGIEHHCLGPCGTTVPFTHQDWTIFRTNTGSVNQNILHDRYYSTCGSIEMTPSCDVTNKSVLNLAAAYPGDQVEVRDTGGYAGYVCYLDTVMFLQIHFTPPLTDVVAPHFAFQLDPTVNSTFTITGSHITTLNGMTLVIPLNNGTYFTMGGSEVMNFLITRAIQNSAKPQWDSLLADSTPNLLNVAADLHLRVSSGKVAEAFPEGETLLNMRTEYMDIGNTTSNPPLAGDSNHSCDSWGGSFSIYQPKVSMGYGNTAFPHSNCDTFTVQYNFNCEGAGYASSSDDFHYEFRPFGKFDSIFSITIPPGYLFKSCSFVTLSDNFDTLGPNFFDLGCTTHSFPLTVFSRTNPFNNDTLPTQITFRGLNNSCFPLFDQKFNASVPSQCYILINTQPVCSAKDTCNFIVTRAGFTVTAQQNDTAFQYNDTLTHPDTLKVIHDNPGISLSSLHTVSDSSNTISFQFQLCDTTSNDATGAWFAIQNKGADSLNLSTATLQNVVTHIFCNKSFYHDSTKGLIFNVGEISHGGCVTLLLTATIDSNSKSCPQPVGVGVGTLVLAYGNVCGDTITAPDAACEDRLDSFSYQVFKTTLQVFNTSKNKDTISLCSNTELIDSLTIVSGNLGTVSDPTFWEKVEPGVTVDSIHITYPCGGAKDTLIHYFYIAAPTQYYSEFDTVAIIDGKFSSVGWILNKDLQIHGLPGIGTNDSLNSACVVVYMHLNCSFNSKDSITFYVSGLSTCGEIIDDSVKMLPKVDTACCAPLLPACVSKETRYDLIINNQTASSLHITSLVDDTILIEGVFTVDTNFSFIGCDIQFAPGAMINIINNSVLHIGQTGLCPHLHAACDTMWRGIFINPGSQLYINKTGLVEDADSAIVSINSAAAQGLYNLQQVVFNKNYKSIVIEQCNGAFGGTTNNCLYTCRNFTSAPTCRWYLDWHSLPVDTALAPWHKPYSFMGIDIRQVYSIALSSDTFDNLQYGIRALVSSMRVYNEEFQNIGFRAGFGAGVVDTGGFYNSVHYNLFADTNTFINCYNGIISDKFMNEVTIEADTIFDSANAPGAFGVYVAEMGFYHPTTLNVEENTITNFYTGIEANMNKVVNANINYNSISENVCNASIWKGISLNEVFTSHKDFYTVDENNVFSNSYGITSNGVHRSVINDNTITLGTIGCPDTTGAGIALKSDGNSAQIGCNVITTPVSSNSYTGIVESQSQFDTVINNTTDSTNIHIRFNGVPSLDDNLWFNQLTTGVSPSVIGILTSSGALYGASMGASGNATDNNFITYFSCRTDLAGVTYYFSTGGFTPLPYCYNSPFPIPGNFVQSHLCLTPLPSPSRDRSHSLINHTNDSISIDSATIVLMENTALSKVIFPELQDTNLVLAKEGLINILWQYPSLLNNGIFKKFNDSISIAPMGRILAIDTGMMSSDSTINYSNLLTTLNSIVPSNNIEANLQTASIEYLNYIIKGTLNANQLTTLRVLANKCPDWDGNGVYMARTVLSMFDPAGTDYSDSCGSNRNEEHKPNKKNTLTTTVVPAFNLYPNPNNGGFTLEYQLQKGQTGVFTIYDMLGKKVDTQLLNPSADKMSENEAILNNGVYLYNISVNNNIVKQDKLVIIKQ